MPELTLGAKITVLNNLGTDKLIHDIQEQEQKLETLLNEDTLFRNQNVSYLASYGDDCREVKSILADLAMEVPFNEDGKKLTIAQTDAWLRQQRSNHKQLADTIKKQNSTTFQVETNRLNMEMAKKRLESLKGVLGLRTAQIEFLK